MWINNWGGQSGQAFVETLLALFPVILAMGAAVALGKSEWNRIRCAHVAFEQAHHRLMIAKPGVEAVGSDQGCGSSHERIILKTLDGLR